MNRPTAGVREGYLLLADISGYTPFFADTELEHAQEIIRELTTLIRERLPPPMRFVKLEGEDGDHADDPRSFARARLPIKLGILIAGVFMNLVQSLHV
jgi:hypothetical protein